ncbi:MAG: T9SS type A sorting domain-containing protein, partial [Bacteroidales bacterium]|nr:T9SS type A sorting domain-containing protein [Bacteroidales bacterium]
FYDIYARKVKQITLPLSQEKISIDISTWHKGMYLAKLINNGKTVATAKILKE